MLEIKNLRVPLDGTLRAAAAKRLRLGEDKLAEVKLLRRAVDARKKTDVHFTAHAAVALKGVDEKALIKRLGDKDITKYAPPAAPAVLRLQNPPEKRPVVVGAGPAGLFAALTLARSGAAPILIERGAPAAERVAAVERFYRTRALDPDSNIQFGEGGAGTFSDGKLNTNTHDVRSVRVLRAFYEAGAPEEILWQAKPHIGTDKLPEVVANLRRRIESLGGEVRFFTRMTDLALENGRVIGIETTKGFIETDTLILAAGHSARELFDLLEKKGANMERKAFSIGVRIEHPRALIDRAQYGVSAGHAALGAADYKLSCHLPNGRSAYTFCMCPGGEVVAAASEAGHLVTNGMSRFARNGENSNSAFLVGITPEDFGGEGLLAGVEFQRKWESTAFALGGGDYTAPAQLLGDFLQGVPSTAAGDVRPSYPLGVRFGDVSSCLPDYVSETLRLAVPEFARRLQGFDRPDAVLTGVESRSSSPVRILRDDSLQSNLSGLYPCGEGAGYAGGILSAAVDGIRVAEAACKQWN